MIRNQSSTPNTYQQPPTLLRAPPVIPSKSPAALAASNSISGTLGRGQTINGVGFKTDSNQKDVLDMEQEYGAHLKRSATIISSGTATAPRRAVPAPPSVVCSTVLHHDVDKNETHVNDTNSVKQPLPQLISETSMQTLNTEHAFVPVISDPVFKQILTNLDGVGNDDEPIEEWHRNLMEELQGLERSLDVLEGEKQ
jgi:hypothetical protein